jgi:hypothetical protein
VPRAMACTVAACAVIVVFAGCGSQADPLSGGATDYAGTNAYVRARAAFLRSSRAGFVAGRAPMAALVAQVRNSCPGSLRNTPAASTTVLPKDGSVAERRTQLAAANFLLALEQGLVTAQEEPLAAATQRFEATVAAIRWSDPRITNAVQTFIDIAQEQRHGAQPDVCGEISRWTRSGFRTLPSLSRREVSGPIAQRWMRDMVALGCGRFAPANAVSVLGVLSLYQAPGIRPNIQEIAASEQRLQVEQLHARADAARSLGQALGVNAPLEVTQPKRVRARRSGSRARKSPGEPPKCTGKPELVSETVKEPAGAEREPIGR